MFSFEERYPDLYKETLENYLNSEEIENRTKEDLNFDPYREFSYSGAIDGIENFVSGYQLTDMCRDFYNEAYDAENKDSFDERYVDEDGNFDFEKFYDEVPDIDVWFHEFSVELYQNQKIYDAIQDVLDEMEQTEYDESEQDEEER